MTVVSAKKLALSRYGQANNEQYRLTLPFWWGERTRSDGKTHVLLTENPSGEWVITPVTREQFDEYRREQRLEAQRRSRGAS